jgi:hypothetical protein
MARSPTSAQAKSTNQTDFLGRDIIDFILHGMSPWGTRRCADDAQSSGTARFTASFAADGTAPPRSH